MKLAGIFSGLVAGGAMLLLAVPALAGVPAPPNSSAISFGTWYPFEFEVGQFTGSTKDNEKSGVDSQVVEVYAPNGDTNIAVQGAALNPDGEGGLVALVWYLQTPNKEKRKEDKLKVSQKTDVAFAVRLYASQADFEDFDTYCSSAYVLLDSCQGEANIKDKSGLQGKFRVKCEDVSASTAATRILEEAGLGCEDGIPSQETLTDLIGSFLDENGKLDLRVKDDAGVRTDDNLVINLFF